MVPLPDRLRPSLLTPMALKTSSAGGGGLALSKTALILVTAVSWLAAAAVFGSVGALAAGAADVEPSAVADGGDASVLGVEAAGGVSVAGLSAAAAWSLVAIAGTGGGSDGAGGGSDGAGGVSFRGGGAARCGSGRNIETLIALSSSASSKNAIRSS